MPALPAYDARVSACVHLLAAQYALTAVPELDYVVVLIDEVRETVRGPRLRLIVDEGRGAAN